MVMHVSNTELQDMLDQWEHMHGFGVNTPSYFLVHDEVSLRDLFQEWVPANDIDRLKMYQFERESDDLEAQTTSPVENLIKEITPELTRDSYFLAMPAMIETDFVMSGWVKAPTPDDPFKVEFGLRSDHRVPYYDDEDDPCKHLVCDSRKSVPHDNHYLNDVKRIACGFPYEAVRMTWSVTTERVGRLKAHLCFWDYQLDDEYIRD